MIKQLFGDKVLIEQILTKKETLIVRPDNAPEDMDNFEVSLKIIKIGEGCTNKKLRVGMIPILHKHCDAVAITYTEDSKDGKSRLMHLVMDVERVIGEEE